MDGLLIIDKPKGITSHDVVNSIRRKFNIRKVGHAGTLDPIATGVLVILVGSYTKRQSEFLNSDKSYWAAMELGTTTTTGDTEGEVVSSRELADISDERIRQAFSRFTGEIEQIPPMYSAKKYKGEPLYRIARKGKTVELEPRRVIIKELLVENIAPPLVSFSVTCSKGTYIRKLCQDIGEELKVGAVMTELRRMRSGRFSIDRAVSLDEVGVEDLLRI